MAELLVRVTDLTDPNIYLDSKLTKRGDVIVVRPDGWLWGIEERTAPFWRIIKSSMSVEEAQAYLKPQVDKDPKNPSKTLLTRAIKFDLDGISTPQTLKNFVDGPRTNDIFDATKIDLNTLKVIKPDLADPLVIG